MIRELKWELAEAPAAVENKVVEVYGKMARGVSQQG
jgi:hypothetical protein